MLAPEKRSINDWYKIFPLLSHNKIYCGTSYIGAFNSVDVC